jgi:hypothetical protein
MFTVVSYDGEGGLSYNHQTVHSHLIYLISYEIARFLLIVARISYLIARRRIEVPTLSIKLNV